MKRQKFITLFTTLCIMGCVGAVSTIIAKNQKQKSEPEPILEAVEAPVWDTGDTIVAEDTTINKEYIAKEITWPPSPELFESAVKYGYNSRFITNYSFILYDNGMTPTPVMMEFVPKNEEYDYDRMAVVDQMPIEDRTINIEYLPHEEGMDDFVAVVESLSANRFSIDFESLYKNYGWIVRKVVSKSAYNERYAPIVDMLLIAHDDLASNDALYGAVENVMQQHWQATLDDPYVGLPDFCPELKRSLSQDVINRLEKFYKSSDTSYGNDYMVIWSYSFWLRRKNEGKTDEIYKTLTAIRNDFKTK